VCDKNKAMKNNAEIAKLLLSKGARATIDSFVIAALRNDVQRMEVLSQSGIELDVHDSSGTPAIVAAAKSGRSDAIAWLIAHNASVNQTDFNGISALSWALAVDNSVAVKMIINSGGVEAASLHETEEGVTEDKLHKVDPVRKLDGKKQSFRSEGLVHMTLSGDLVRSKSEVIVADALYYRSIPFGYEIPFFGQNGKRFKIPDFTIKLPSGTTVVWEHLGMLDQERYRRNWDKKRLWYTLNGLDHSNLYVTEDNQSSGINSHEIAAVADRILERFRE
jgi:ankyrin repeat protein